MKNILMLAGAGMMLALGTQAEAKPKAGVKASAKAHVLDVNHNGVADWRERRLADANGNGILDFRERTRVDINRNGIPDFRERFIDRDRDGIDDRQEALSRRFGGNLCPPGLAKKEPSCIPPGQVGRGFRVGERVPTGFGTLRFRSIPLTVRNQFDLDSDDVFIHRGDTLIVVDPRTRLVERIINDVIF